MNSQAKVEEKIKAFGMSNAMMLQDLIQLQQRSSIDLGLEVSLDRSVAADYYPQFRETIRYDARQMARHYELFYCLERTIREIVASALEQAEGTPDWWSGNRILPALKTDIASRIQRDRDSGFTLRSTDELDFSTFGELSQIITGNWDVFGALFSSKKAVEKIMSSLNSLRGPIAHCSSLAEDEVLRLNLTVRDWFRLME